MSRLKQMKNGPVKAIVERELRDFANDLEARCTEFEAYVARTALHDAEDIESRMDILRRWVEELMQERGINPKP